MQQINTPLDQLLAELTHTVEEFIATYKHAHLRTKLYDRWTIKEIFIHIVSWHQEYVAVLKALAHHQQPVHHAGPVRFVSQAGIDRLRHRSMKDLIVQLRSAQKDFEGYLQQLPDDQVIPYPAGTSTYDRQQFVHSITRHVIGHSEDIRRANRQAQR